MSDEGLVGAPLPFGGTGRLRCQVLDSGIVLTDPQTGCRLTLPRGNGILNWQVGLSEADEAGAASFDFPGTISPPG